VDFQGVAYNSRVPEGATPVAYPFKGTVIHNPEWEEAERKVHALVQEGKLTDARALLEETVAKGLSPEIVEQMRAAVKAEEDAPGQGSVDNLL
jgi:hypothetical protein